MLGNGTRNARAILWESAVTVLGFGDLGSEVAKRCHALGARDGG